jgi:NAD(P)-dependent dehydrogenase (short-subunit alcohol dehydrogenase family)
VVTGAGRGLGFELCQVYLGQGWTVFPVIRAADATARFRSAPVERCHPIVADLSNDSAVTIVRRGVARQTTHLDLLINNAGIPGHAAHLATVTSRETAELFDVHCLGVLRCTQAVLPQLSASGSSKVVNVTSRLGSLSRNASGDFDDEEVSYSYRVAKASQNMLTICLSKELRRNGIVVCALHPGQFHSSINPDTPISAAAAARRLADRVETLAQPDQGRWYDVSGRVIEW